MATLVRLSLYKQVRQGAKRLLKDRPTMGKAIAAAGLLGGADLAWQIGAMEEEDVAAGSGLNLQRTGEAMALGLFVVGPAGKVFLRGLEKRALANYPPPFMYDSKAWLFKIGVAQAAFFGSWASLHAANATVCESQTPSRLAQKIQAASAHDLESQLRHQGLMTGAFAIAFKFAPVPSQFTFLLGSHLALEAIEEFYRTAWLDNTRSTEVMLC